MMDALGKEPDADVQSTMMESICEIVELVGGGQGSHTHTHTHTHRAMCV